MTDVGKVEGPSGSPENLGKKDKSSADPDKFRQEMRKKVTEVSKIDPDEKKKRKRPEEDEEEDLNATQTDQNPEPITPFSLHAETQKISPADLQKVAAKPSQRMGASGGQAPETPQMQAPSQTPGKSPTEAAQTPKEAQTPAIPTSPHPPSGQQPQTPKVKHPSEKKGKDEAAEVMPLANTPLKEPHQTAVPPKRSVVSKEGITAAELENGQSPKAEDASGLFQQLTNEEKLEEKHRYPADEAALTQGALPSLPLEKQENAPLLGASLQPTEPSLPQISPPPVSEASALPPYANFPPEVQGLFERMVGVMSVMHLSGMTETVITLNAPQFASSVFFGSQIIIQEFSTAPKAFNIQLNAAPQAIALLQANTSNLMAAFQGGNYAFRVNRFETGYLAERPLFRRREDASGGNQDTGDHPK